MPPKSHMAHTVLPFFSRGFSVNFEENLTKTLNKYEKCDKFWTHAKHRYMIMLDSYRGFNNILWYMLSCELQKCRKIRWIRDASKQKQHNVFKHTNSVLRDTGVQMRGQTLNIYAKTWNVFKHTNSVLRDNDAQSGLRTLNKYVKKVMYTNIRLAFCASMPHGWTKSTRRKAEKVIRFSKTMTIKFDTLILI